MVRSRSSFTFVLPVFICIVFLGSELMSRLFSEQSNARTLSDHVTQIDIIGDLVHELQRERGLSSGVLASGGRALLADLAAQRDRTDVAMATLHQTWGATDLSNRQSSIMQSLLQVRRLRLDTDGHAISNIQVVERYSMVVDELLAASIVTPQSITAQTR